MPSGLTWLVEAKPQVPLTITLTPTPNDSTFTMFWTFASRVFDELVQVPAYSDIGVGRTVGSRSVERDVGELFFLRCVKG